MATLEHSRLLETVVAEEDQAVLETKRLTVAFSALALAFALTSCATGPGAVVDLVSAGEAAETGVEQIAAANKAVIGGHIANAVTALETTYAIEGEYALAQELEHITYVSSDAGYIIKGNMADNPLVGYRVSGSTDIYWFDTAPDSVDDLAAAGASIPEGVSELP
jgi:predicted small secreted protein